MKTIFFILSALTLMAVGCNKNMGKDSGSEIQKEEKFDRDGDTETYQLEEKRVVPENEMQKEEVTPGSEIQKDENHDQHIQEQQADEARRSADESVDLTEE